MNIGIIGTGKRFENVYDKILSKMNCKMFLWNRTKEKIKKYQQKNNTRYVEVTDINDLSILKLDLVLCFIPSSISYDIIDKLNISCNILIETPVEDERWIHKKNVGVLEQWPFMPIELFKQKLYEENLINRPYWISNDGRSFDYHAIAQLRSYCQNPDPLNVFGLIQNINQNGFIDKNEKLNTTSHEWTHGMLRFENNLVLNYNFSYNCKNTTLIPFQMLKAYSSNGSVISGRSHLMDNDYELFEIRYLDNHNKVLIKNPKREQVDNITKKIFLKNENIFWENKFFDLQFDDHQTSIAYLIQNAIENKLYSTRDAFINSLTMFLIKKSSFDSKNISIR